MSYIITIINFISCVVSSTIVFDFMERLFKRSYKTKYKLFFIILTLFMFVINSCQNTYLNYFGTFIYFFILCNKLYFSHELNIYLYAFLFIIIQIATEIVTVIIFNSMGIFILIDNLTQYAFSTVGSLLINLMIYRLFIIKFFTSKNIKSKNYTLEFILLVLSISIMAFLYYVSIFDIPFIGKIFAIILCILILMYNLISIFLNDKNSKLEILQNQENMEKVKNHYEYLEYQQNQNKYFNEKKLFHDLKDHLLVLEKLYHLGEYKKAIEYNDELMRALNMGAHFTEDTTIQILLTKAYKECKLYNIEFIYRIKDDVNLNTISDFDKVTIFSNILNNAIEALSTAKLNDKYINLDIMKLNDAFVISLKNNHDTSIILENDNLNSSKLNHSGIGISNVCKAVEKNEGMVDINYNNSTFNIVIYIPYNGTENDNKTV